MTKFECPSCGAEVVFQSSVSIFAVCQFCRSMVVRHDLNVEAIGKMAVLPDDNSPFQLGTQGYYENVIFTLVGKVRRSWVDGFWNEWHALFVDGKSGWLAEAQGMYMFTLEQQIENLPDLDMLSLNSKFPIKGRYFFVKDIKKTVCVGSEGELPWMSPAGREQTSVDLASDDGKKFACLEFSAEGEKRCFMGNYVEFKELRLSYLRQFDGW